VARFLPKNQERERVGDTGASEKKKKMKSIETETNSKGKPKTREIGF